MCRFSDHCFVYIGWKQLCFAFNHCFLEQKIQRDILFGVKPEPEMVGYRLTGRKGFLIIYKLISLELLCR